MSTLNLLLFIIVLIIAVFVIGAFLSAQEQGETPVTPPIIARRLGLNYSQSLDLRQLKRLELAEVLAAYLGPWQDSYLKGLQQPEYKMAFAKRHAQNVFSGQVKGIELFIFTYTYLDEGISPIPLYYQHTVFAIRTQPESNLPSFVIRPMKFLDMLKQTIGEKITTIPAAPNLMLQTYYADYFSKIPPAVWQFIESKQWHILHDGKHNWFMVCGFNQNLKMDQESYQTFIKSGLELYFGLLPTTNQLKTVFEE